MVKINEEKYAGYECVRLDNGVVSAWVIKEGGPRVIGLALNGRDNLFAVTPDFKLPCPGAGEYSLRGGHRLWHAPEDPRRTYLPDDLPVRIEEIEDGLLLIQPLETETRILKSIQIRLPNEKPLLEIDHRLKNLSMWPVELAPWAVTQMKPGGLAVFPQTTGNADEYGLLPNRQITLWPYSDAGLDLFKVGNRFIFIDVNLEDGMFKFGFPNPSGWMGYFVDGSFFVKRAPYQPGEYYYDGGSSSECYFNPLHIELETLGPSTILLPGDSAGHREVWQVFPDVEGRQDENRMADIAEELDLFLACGMSAQ
jgi:hypothetical protein